MPHLTIRGLPFETTIHELTTYLSTMARRSVFEVREIFYNGKEMNRTAIVDFLTGRDAFYCKHELEATHYLGRVLTATLAEEQRKRPRSRSPSPRRSKPSMNHLNAELERLRKERKLLEEERKLLLEKRKLEMLKDRKSGYLTGSSSLYSDSYDYSGSSERRYRDRSSSRSRHRSPSWGYRDRNSRRSRSPHHHSYRPYPRNHYRGKYFHNAGTYSRGNYRRYTPHMEQGYQRSSDSTKEPVKKIMTQIRCGVKAFNQTDSEYDGKLSHLIRKIIKDRLCRIVDGELYTNIRLVITLYRRYHVMLNDQKLVDEVLNALKEVKDQEDGLNSDVIKEMLKKIEDADKETEARDVSAEAELGEDDYHDEVLEELEFEMQADEDFKNEKIQVKKEDALDDNLGKDTPIEKGFEKDTPTDESVESKIKMETSNGGNENDENAKSETVKTAIIETDTKVESICNSSDDVDDKSNIIDSNIGEITNVSAQESKQNDEEVKLSETKPLMIVCKPDLGNATPVSEEVKDNIDPKIEVYSIGEAKCLSEESKPECVKTDASKFNIGEDDWTDIGESWGNANDEQKNKCDEECTKEV